jgi:hypothetical protein
VLKVVNPLYADVQLHNEADISHRLLALPEQLISSALIVSDERDIRIEEAMVSNVARPEGVAISAGMH